MLKVPYEWGEWAKGLAGHPGPPKMDTIDLDHFEIALGGGAVHLHAGGKVICLSFSDVERIAFQIQTWKQLNGYPEASPPQFP